MLGVTGNCGFIAPFSLEFGEITTDLVSRICRATKSKTQSQGHGQDSFVIARFDGVM